MLSHPVERVVFLPCRSTVATAPVEAIAAAHAKVLATEGSSSLQYSVTEGFGPIRDDVPIPPFHPKATVPAPAPTAPSATGPLLADVSAETPEGWAGDVTRVTLEDEQGFFGGRKPAPAAKH